MKMRKGQTAAEVIIGLLVMIGVIIACVGGCFNKHVFGNKQVFDFKQNFRYAYLSQANGTIEKIKIEKWNDYENSDSIQFIDENGKVYYTHLNRVILSNK